MVNHGISHGTSVHAWGPRSPASAVVEMIAITQVWNAALEPVLMGVGARTKAVVVIVVIVVVVVVLLLLLRMARRQASCD